MSDAPKEPTIKENGTSTSGSITGPHAKETYPPGVELPGWPSPIRHR